MAGARDLNLLAFPVEISLGRENDIDLYGSVFTNASGGFPEVAVGDNAAASHWNTLTDAAGNQMHASLANDVDPPLDGAIFQLVDPS